MARMEFEFTPDWQFVRQLRVFVNHLISVRTRDTELAARVGMAVTELMENAVKYSKSENAIIRISVKPGTSLVRVEAENEAGKDQIEELKKVLDSVNAGDANEAYVRALSGATAADTDSKVGLARVRHEGQMVLRCEVQENRVKVIAEWSGEVAA